MNRRIATLFLMGTCVLGLVGCGQSSGPQLGNVQGTITLDGKPLPDATVRFIPVEGGRPAYGVTDGTGQYKLQFTGFKEGALVGLHSVKIEVGMPIGESEETKPRTVKQLPAIYSDKTELEAEVERGSNTIDFALSSK